MLDNNIIYKSNDQSFVQGTKTEMLACVMNTYSNR